MRHPKEKHFDPFKLDVYALGLTLLVVCSMGRFSLEERSHYIYDSSQRSHADFIKEERRKWVTRTDYKPFNCRFKMMLEEDQYKRDDFNTLIIKTKEFYEAERSDCNRSEDRSNDSASVRRKAKKMIQAKRHEQLRNQESKVYGSLTLIALLFFVMVCLF